MRKTNEASLFSYNGESINEGEQRKAAVAVAVAVAVAPEFDSIRDELSLQFLGNLGIHRLFLLNLV